VILSFLDPIGREIIRVIELVASLSVITAVASMVAALMALWVMQVTTQGAGLCTPNARWTLLLRVSFAFLSLVLALNAVTPFVTPDPPWLANLPLVVSIMILLVSFGVLHKTNDQ
jgi:hypothetical protein